MISGYDDTSIALLTRATGAAVLTTAAGSDRRRETMMIDWSERLGDGGFFELEFPVSG
mgnify:FL=1